MSGKPVDAMRAGTTSGTTQVLLGHHLRECARDGVEHPCWLLRLVELELIHSGPHLF